MTATAHLKTGIFLLLALSLGLTIRQASADADHSTRPEFNERGEIVVITRRGEEKFTLHTLDPSTGKDQVRELELGPGANLPLLKKDSRGRLWAAWTEPNGLRTRVVLGMIQDTLHLQASLDIGLQSSLPWDFCFDNDDRVWFAWVEEVSARQTVRVQGPAAGQVWTVSSWTQEAHCPRLLCGAGGALWVFWTAVTPDQEQVFSSRFDGSDWSRELLLTSDTSMPSLTPSAAAGSDGRIWLVWSGYDGRDYEIQAKIWDGRRWSPALAVTDNAGANDIFPSLDLAFGTLPVVSWVRYTEKGRREIMRCGQPEGWFEEMALPPPTGGQPFVPLAVREDLAVWTRPDGESLRGERLFLPFLAQVVGGRGLPASTSRVSPHQGLPPLPDFIYNPDLKENFYIGFGDSITYGVCDEDRIDEPTDYIPEKAYPPRLEALLTQNFGTHSVVNEGVPGESTFQGLARIKALLAEHQARYILLLEGTNDIIWNDYSLETTSFNLREMIRHSLEYGLLPALATCIPRFGWNANRNRLNNLNARIRLLAGECQIPLVDLYQDFDVYPAEDGGVESLYCWGEDRTHPNEKGYQFMAEKWFERIRNFPFPPGDPRVSRSSDDILFFSAAGNLLEWVDSPKISDPARIQEYRVYRKKAAEDPAAFRLLSAVSGQRYFFDTDIQPGLTYTYAVATVIAEDIQGPCTQPLIR